MDPFVKTRKERWKEYGFEYAKDHEKDPDNWEYREVARLLNPQKDEKILDIGCNTGEFCSFLKKRFITNPRGIDINREAIKVARIKYPEIPFDVKDISHFEKEEEYDGIVMIEVIEHLSDLPEVLAKVKRLLKPHGRIVLSTPNQWAFLFKLKSRILGRDFTYDPLHLREFTPLSLTALLNSEGLKVSKVYTKVLGLPFLRRVSVHLYTHFPSLYFGRWIFCIAHREE